MKQLFLLFSAFVLFSCEDTTQQSDNEKSESKNGIEIKTDSNEIKINSNGITVSGTDGNKDTVGIKINEKDGIKVEGKDGKIQINTDNGGKIKVQKKGKEVNIQVNEQ
ncbi:MAG: hypothetical protein U0T11_04825 [Chitinophagaceae bacterium]